jgi:hypothetical protein
MFENLVRRRLGVPKIVALSPCITSHHALLRSATGTRFATVIAWAVVQSQDTIGIVEGIVLDADGMPAVATLLRDEQLIRYVAEEVDHG